MPVAPSNALTAATSSPRRRFREILAGSESIVSASVFDPLSARIAESLGFRVGMLGGSTAALAVLGEPDLALLTLTELADLTHRICRASPLPLLVDADAGYGNALNARRMVNELEDAGVAAATIEDTVLPAVHGGRGAVLASIEEGVGKLRSALDARRDPQFAVIARTSLTGEGGLADGVRRAKAYEAAGVDAIFIQSARTRHEVNSVAKAVRLPLIFTATEPELTDPIYLASRRVRVVLQGHRPFAAAVAAVHETLRALREGAPAETIPEHRALLDEFSRAGIHAGRMRDFMSRE